MDPETTNIILTSTVKYDKTATSKTADTLKSETIEDLTAYNSNTLQSFDSMLRHSKLIEINLYY